MVVTTKERIESRIIRIPIAGCWLWTGTVDRKGYARLSMWVKEKGHNNPKIASRISYSEYVGPIPDGMSILHRCDTPLCVNPHHLFLGTQADNMNDMLSKGRGKNVTMKNCKNGHPLSEENVRIESNGKKRKIRRCKKCESIKKAAKYQRKKMEKLNDFIS